MNIVEVLEKTMAVFVSNGNSIHRQLRQGDVWCKIKLGLIIDETREKIENLPQTGFAVLHFEYVQNVACDVGFLSCNDLIQNVNRYLLYYQSVEC